MFSARVWLVVSRYVTGWINFESYVADKTGKDMVLTRELSRLAAIFFTVSAFFLFLSKLHGNYVTYMIVLARLPTVSRLLIALNKREGGRTNQRITSFVNQKG